MEWRSYTCIAEKNYAPQYAGNCQKIEFWKYALCPGIKKINPQCLFQHVTYSYKCIKIFFLHNIAPRMNGILENLHLENSINLCIWEKKHKLVLIFSCVD